MYIRYIYIYTSVLLAISIANKTFCVQDVQVHLASTSGQFLMTLQHILQCVRAVLNDSSKWRPQVPFKCPSAAQVVHAMAARWKSQRATAQAKRRPSRPKRRPGGVQEASKRRPSWPKSVQVGPRASKRRPRAAKRRPRAAKFGPRGAQEQPSSAQEASKRPKRRPRGVQVGPKRRPSGPKRRPRGSQRRQRGSKLDSKDVQEASKSDKTAVQAQFDSKQGHPVKTMVFLRKIEVFVGQERSGRPVWRAKSGQEASKRRP